MKIWRSTWNTYLVWYLTLHCALENGADLYVNERQKIRDYCARSPEEKRRRRRKKKKNAKSRFFTSRDAYVNLRYIENLRSINKHKGDYGHTTEAV